ncbi:chemotaxis-specific protein-glutamate methyltransferase CheB [Aurantiacibacter sediminis]|nr:chemotaxis-specific protein-glutamate methyltransferase CheB [Aurantiacibacter sediminis]
MSFENTRDNFDTGAGDASDGAVRVMVVDDSLTARTVLGKVIERTDELSLAGTASSAEQAIGLLDTVVVDVILLDLEMPGMGGLAGLPHILEKSGGAKVLVVSSLTAEGAQETITALSMGASDVVQKPEPGQFNAEYRADLAKRIRALAGATAAPAAEEVAQDTAPQVEEPTLRKAPNTSVDCIAIGGSTGGIHSLVQFLGKLPKSINTPIVVTQHLPNAFIPIFASQVETASNRPTRIAEDGMELTRGEILVAPGDGHVSFMRKGAQVVVKITHEAVPSGCCPSVDPMLATLGEALEGRVIGVVLSGMGRDGQNGAKTLVEHGGTMVAECEETSAVWGMPRGIAEAGLASEIAAPVDLAHWITRRTAVAV